ncbi:MAG: hypothetical protein KME22_21485 [Hassallia sp. WJT32-NPBG1]|nr:hypothetical protein [Hassallia sp. WJT32-NPBG1]
MPAQDRASGDRIYFITMCTLYHHCQKTSAGKSLKANLAQLRGQLIT